MGQEMKKNVISNDEANIAKSIRERGNTIKSRKKKRNRLVPILCVIIGILIGILCTIILVGRDEVKEAENNDEQIVGKNTMETILEEESFKIETSKIDLYYPAKWESQIRTEETDGEVASVQFIATIAGKEEIHIFDIVFGGENGSLLGYIEDETGEKVSINIVSHDFELDNEWGEEEKNIIYTMAEDVNYLIGMLQKEEKFVPAN